MQREQMFQSDVSCATSVCLHSANTAPALAPVRFGAMPRAKGLKPLPNTAWRTFSELITRPMPGAPQISQTATLPPLPRAQLICTCAQATDSLSAQPRDALPSEARQPGSSHHRDERPAASFSTNTRDNDMRMATHANELRRPTREVEDVRRLHLDQPDNFGAVVCRAAA